MARIIGTLRSEILCGTCGDDFMRGDGGNDTLYGKEGDDAMYGDAGNDMLDGGCDDDLLYGGTGMDVLYGGDGCDLLVGGAGDDCMDGGCGWDAFLFNGVTLATNGSDTIHNYDVCDDVMLFNLFTVNAAIAVTGDSLCSGTLDCSNFESGYGLNNLADDCDDYFLYDKCDGSLYFDKDGDGAEAAVLLVTLCGAPCIDACEIVLV